jgi:hypothetical protein
MDPLENQGGKTVDIMSIFGSICIIFLHFPGRLHASRSTRNMVLSHYNTRGYVDGQATAHDLPSGEAIAATILDPGPFFGQ